MDIKELEKIVRELNYEVLDAADKFHFDFDDFGYVGFVVHSSGYELGVDFLGLNLWNSENDERSYKEGLKDAELEPLDNFLRRRTHDLLKKLSLISLWKDR